MPSPIDQGTVLVTGASSGIGREIARIVAPRCRRLVLVARRTERLRELADELSRDHRSLEVFVIACDLADRAALAALVAKVHDEVGEVDVLVNNAGVGTMSVFDRSQLDKQLTMIDLNVTALVSLTHAFLPGMVARGRGSVFMVGSGFGLSVSPGFATYVGTKHFITGFTESLAADLAGTGVHVGQICPGPVATEFEENTGNFTGQPIPAFLQISAAQCAQATVTAIDDAVVLAVPHVFVRLGLALLPFVPRFVVRLAAGVRVLGKPSPHDWDEKPLGKHVATQAQPRWPGGVTRRLSSETRGRLNRQRVGRGRRHPRRSPGVLRERGAGRMVLEFRAAEATAG
jgi:short-subunit dehydrogenase